jgi:hypothetical protein
MSFHIPNSPTSKMRTTKQDRTGQVRRIAYIQVQGNQPPEPQFTWIVHIAISQPKIERSQYTMTYMIESTTTISLLYLHRYHEMYIKRSGEQLEPRNQKRKHKPARKNRETFPSNHSLGTGYARTPQTQLSPVLIHPHHHPPPDRTCTYIAQLYRTAYIYSTQ